MTIQPYIYLASKSPRRRDLLLQIGINFQTLQLSEDPRRIPDVDETPRANENAPDYVQRICRAKAVAAWESLLFRKLPPAPLLAADTTVALDNIIIGKPRDKNDAAAILRLLSGRQHQIFTAIAVILQERIELRLSVTEVTFAELSDERIQRYISGDEALDKAGAYGIQGIAGAFVQRIEGSYSAVVGLPLYETAELLQSFGYPAP
jgi:septum formation protein